MQEKEMARLQGVVDRFGAKASKAAMAHSIEKRIARIEDTKVEGPTKDKKLKVRFPEPPTAGQTAALSTDQVAAFQTQSGATTARDPNVEKFGTLIASLGDKIGIETTARDAKFERFENLTSSLQDRLSGATTARDTRFEGFGTTLASLLSDMRKSTGPNNNYNPSLTNAVYTPPINREEDTYKTNTADAAEQYSKDQIIAFNTMSGKLDDMITLLSKSVNIQGDTLRATYSA
jgi:hypothetical protein